MNSFIAVLLAQDGLTTGAIYALLAIALVMLFSVTRVVLVPQGEIISFAGLTLAAVQAGRMPGTLWILVIGGVLVAALDLWAYFRGDRSPSRLRKAALYFAGPLIVAGLSRAALGLELPQAAAIALTLLIVVPIAPIMYRLAFEPLANASVLVLLMVAVAIHFALMGLGLLFFGPEGSRTAPLFPEQLMVGGFMLSQQALFVVLTTLLLMGAMGLFFGRTLRGKALRATAMNRTGARIVGIRTESAGVTAFLLAGLIGAVSGILISPITTIYYDTGFLIGLKGFMAAIVGGLASYPLAVLGAVVIGLLETFSSFYASSYKEAIVFALIIPILMWRSFTTRHAEEEEEE
jgi:branched-chain amino acid transport system permease protein